MGTMSLPNFRGSYTLLSKYVNLCSVAVYILSFLVSANLILTLKGNLGAPKLNANRSFGNDDYPLFLSDAVGLSAAAMTLHESVHYELNDKNMTLNEWRRLWEDYPYTVHLGEDKRLFALVLYHQLHCLRAIEYAYIFPSNKVYTLGHVQHCLNYLRQTLLCAANEELEFGDFLKWDFSPGSVHHTSMVCRDWDAVQSHLAATLQDFNQWKTKSA